MRVCKTREDVRGSGSGSGSGSEYNKYLLKMHYDNIITSSCWISQNPGLLLLILHTTVHGVCCWKVQFRSAS